MCKFSGSALKRIILLPSVFQNANNTINWQFLKIMIFSGSILQGLADGYRLTVLMMVAGSQFKYNRFIYYFP